MDRLGRSPPEQGGPGKNRADVLRRPTGASRDQLGNMSPPPRRWRFGGASPFPRGWRVGGASPFSRGWRFGESGSRSRGWRFGIPGLFIAALGIAVLAGAGRAALRVAHGLAAEYFTNPDRTGPPLLTGVDAEPSTIALSRSWQLDAPPETFSARWRGYLAVRRSGLYRFATTSDDGSWVYVDGRLVVDNSGTHGALTRSGQTFLESGPHFLLVEYFQAGGASAL